MATYIITIINNTQSVNGGGGEGVYNYKDAHWVGGCVANVLTCKLHTYYTKVRLVININVQNSLVH